MNQAKQWVDVIRGSAFFSDYATAFQDTAGVPLSFEEVDSRGARIGNGFCSRVGLPACDVGGCPVFGERLTREASGGAACLACPRGLSRIAVPVTLGDRVLGFLVTGQFRTQPLASAQANELRVAGASDDAIGRYEASPVLSPRQRDAIIHLLAIFAEHLEIRSNELAVHQAGAEPALVSRARRYIDEHHAEDLTLGGVAQAVHASLYYFCKLFHKVTRLTFTEYVARTRVERAKALLLNPNLRVSEVAFQVGFQSLTHFNRTFRLLVGETPSRYRERLPRPVQ
jgi:AraC-like DNA-binding protein